MLIPYVRKRVLFFNLSVLATVASMAEPDTTILNQTEFRFPETQPGKVFVVKKLLINEDGGVGQRAEPLRSDAAASAGAPAALSRNRDVLGRTMAPDAWQARLNRMAKKHSLPIRARGMRVADAPFKPPRVIEKGRMNARSRVAVASNSPLIRDATDLARMEVEERRASAQRHGAIEPSFRKILQTKGPDDSLEVRIVLAQEIPGYLNRFKASLEEQKQNARRWAHTKTLISKKEILQRYRLKEIDLPQSRSDKHLVTKTSVSKIRELARAHGISAIESRPQTKPAAPGNPLDYQILLDAGYNPAYGMVFPGGASIATIEVGLSNSFLNCIPSELQPRSPYQFLDFEFYTQAHSNATYYMAALGTPGEGYQRYHFHMSWANSQVIDSAIDVVSDSYQMTVSRPPTDQDIRLWDNLSYIWPYPVVVKVAGNHGIDSVVSDQNYNAISVGNVRHADNTHFEIKVPVNGPLADFPTQTRNPAPNYGSTVDRELPLLVAPGFVPVLPTPGNDWDYFFSECIENTGVIPYSGYWQTLGGTSFSAPVVAAIAAHVRGAISYSWTHAGNIRAVLLATAENVEDGYWNPAWEDSKDGAGTVSGNNAVQFAMNAQGTYPVPLGETMATPVENGLWDGWFDSTGFASHGTQVPLVLPILTPSQIPEGKHLRVVLTWSSSPAPPGPENHMEHEVSDWDLQVDAGWAGSFMSTSYNGNVEMVDIEAEVLTENSEYTITLWPQTYRKASGGPTEQYIHVAWTWVKDHAD